MITKKKKKEIDYLNTFLLAVSRIYQLSVICNPILANIWNDEILFNKNFPENLKLPDVSPVFKKKDKTVVERRKSCQDKQGFAGALLMDLSKAFGRGSEFSSYQIELRKMTSHFELLTRS